MTLLQGPMTSSFIGARCFEPYPFIVSVDTQPNESSAVSLQKGRSTSTTIGLFHFFPCWVLLDQLEALMAALMTQVSVFASWPTEASVSQCCKWAWLPAPETLLSVPRWRGSDLGM